MDRWPGVPPPANPTTHRTLTLTPEKNKNSMSRHSQLGHSTTDRPKKSRNNTLHLRYRLNFAHKVIVVVDSRGENLSLVRPIDFEIWPRAIFHLCSKLQHSSNVFSSWFIELISNYISSKSQWTKDWCDVVNFLNFQNFVFFIFASIIQYLFTTCGHHFGEMFPTPKCTLVHQLTTTKKLENGFSLKWHYVTLGLVI